MGIKYKILINIVLHFIKELIQKKYLIKYINADKIIVAFYMIIQELMKHNPLKLGVELSLIHYSLLITAKFKNGKNIHFETFFKTEQGVPISVINVFENRKQMLTQHGNIKELLEELSNLI